MSKPTEEEIARLERHHGDAEYYHGEFDDLLEEKLKELDPEWVKAMLKIYADSGKARWYA